MGKKGRLVPSRKLIKLPEQIEGIRKSGLLNTAVLDCVEENIREGISTAEIDRLVYEYTMDHQGIPATLGYHGFPNSCCISVNEVVCHGIPNENQVLHEGDIVNVDCTTIVNGFYADASRMFIIGKTSSEKEKLNIILPDKEFERIAEYILKYDPNPRKVIKLLQNFTEEDKELLLKYLSINNAILYNEVLGLQYCDTTHFEEYEGIELDIDIETESEEFESGQSGIPADFFLTAAEYDESDHIIDNIIFAYDRLNEEERRHITEHCIKIRKKKTPQSNTEADFMSIQKEAEQEADLFMELYKKSLEESAGTIPFRSE